VDLMGGFVPLRLDIPTSPAGPKPAVISLLDAREPLTDAGMVVVTYRQNWAVLRGLVPLPEPEPPKNTVGSWLLAAPTPKTVGRGWFSMIAVDAETIIPQVLSYLGTLPEIDMSRVAIMGSSTKGFAAMRAAADRRIAVAVLLAACGDYHTFLHLSPLAMNGAPLDLDRHYDAELRRLEPIRHPGRFTHAAILMMNGTADKAVPIECARTTARALSRAYARAGAKERFRFVVIEGAGHTDLGTATPAEIAVWLHRWLRPTPPSH
jgi:pimeloyl-ACP methyl ester carboxylesterase